VQEHRPEVPGVPHKDDCQHCKLETKKKKARTAAVSERQALEAMDPLFKQFMYALQTDPSKLKFFQDGLNKLHRR